MVHKTEKEEKKKKGGAKEKRLASHHHRRNLLFGLAQNSSQFSVISTQGQAEIKVSHPKRQGQRLKKRKKSNKASKPISLR